MLDRGGINSLIRLIHTIVNEKFLHFSRGSGGTGTPPVPPETMKNHPLDPDDGPHTGALTEADVALDDAAGHDHQGAGDTGKKVDAKDLADTDGQLLTGAQKTDLTDGGATVLHEHAEAVTAAVKITLTNETGGERTLGDVVVTDPDNDESFIGTSGSGYQGKVLVVAETIASSGSGPCWERGGPFNIEVVGAVNRNDGLRTSATIYKAEAAPSVISTGVFAIALSSSGSGGGTIKALFLDVISVGGGDGGGAPTDAKYVITEANAQLTAEVLRPQFAYFLPETPPVSPHSADDEFVDAVLDGKWAWSAGPPTFSLTNLPGWIEVVPPNATGYYLREAFSPSGAFTVTMKGSWNAKALTHYFGLQVTNAAWGRIVGLEARTQGNWGHGLYTDNGPVNLNLGMVYSTFWLCIQRSSGNAYTLWFSFDGITWFFWVSLGVIATEVAGLVLRFGQTTSDTALRYAVDYIRVTEP